MKSVFINACVLFCAFYLPVTAAWAQNKTGKPDTVFCDCAKAREVKINSNQKIGPTQSPPGPGEQNEITSSRFRSPYVFEKEHRTAWYKLIIFGSGNLSFDIFPTRPEDDYDFILFKAGNNNFCDSLSKYPIKPLRSNISRDKNELQGKTGLSLKAKKELVKEGVNDAYSLSVHVEKGEVYYLVLDNVYENGDGHTILFFFEQKVDIKGVVKDDEDKPLITTVTITDVKGQTIAETTTDAKTGAYDVKAIFKKNTTYSINYFNDSSFVFSKTISLKDSVALKDIRVVLPKLKKGRKYSIGAINFYVNSPVYLPGALPSIENLHKLLQKNKKLQILIEGHVNCATPTKTGQRMGSPYDDELSLQRAQTIQSYLVKKGIAASRLSVSGKGCSEMLFPVTIKEEEMELNRRVEIKVVEFY